MKGVRRTMKWQETLTLKQIKHLMWSQANGLRWFKDLRLAQRKQAKKWDIPLWKVCPECDEIERRLKLQGHKFEEVE